MGFLFSYSIRLGNSELSQVILSDYQPLRY